MSKKNVNDVLTCNLEDVTEDLSRSIFGMINESGQQHIKMYALNMYMVCAGREDGDIINEFVAKNNEVFNSQEEKDFFLRICDSDTFSNVIIYLICRWLYNNKPEYRMT